MAPLNLPAYPKVVQEIVKQQALSATTSVASAPEPPARQKVAEPVDVISEPTSINLERLFSRPLEFTAQRQASKRHSTVHLAKPVLTQMV